MNDYLGVGFRPEVVTVLLKFFPQLNEIVDFPVKGNPHRSVLVRQWLRSATKVDNAQTSVAESDASIHVNATAIRSSMCENERHPSHECLICSELVELKYPANSAH
jgi:hypothetical protein